MSKPEKYDFQAALVGMESEIALITTATESDSHLHETRSWLRRAILSVCEITPDRDKAKLADILDVVVKGNKGRRETSILIVRALSVDGLLAVEDGSSLGRRVVELIEGNFGDQCKSLK